jgi:hypothetical protein
MSSEAQAEKHESIIEALHDCDFPLQFNLSFESSSKNGKACPSYIQTNDEAPDNA